MLQSTHQASTSQSKRKQRREFDAGETLELAAGFCWSLEQGEVLVHCTDRPVELWRSPSVLDVGGMLVGKPRARFVAVGPVVVHGVAFSAMSPSDIHAVLLEENQRLWQRVQIDARRDDDTFLPEAVPVPGPWHFRQAQTAVFVIQGRRDKIKRVLPRGVHILPGTGGRYLLAVSRFERAGSLDPRDTTQFSYHEVAPFLPVWSGARGPTAYLPVLYPDAHMAATLGREIHGFPKRTARIGWWDDGAELIVGKALTMRARWTERVPLQPTDVVLELATTLFDHRRAQGAASLLERAGKWFTPPLSVLVRKRIGAAATSGRTHQIDELCRVPLKPDAIQKAERLSGVNVELLRTRDILHGEVLGGWYLESGFRFGPGKRERRLV